MRLSQIIALSLFLIFGAAWLMFVWPTEWDYYKSGSRNIRVNRFTGTTQVLGSNGWR